MTAVVVPLGQRASCLCAPGGAAALLAWRDLEIVRPTLVFILPPVEIAAPVGNDSAAVARPLARPQSRSASSRPFEWRGCAAPPTERRAAAPPVSFHVAPPRAVCVRVARSVRAVRLTQTFLKAIPLP